MIGQVLGHAELAHHNLQRALRAARKTRPDRLDCFDLPAFLDRLTKKVLHRLTAPNERFSIRPNEPFSIRPNEPFSNRIYVIFQSSLCAHSFQNSLFGSFWVLFYSSITRKKKCQDHGRSARACAVRASGACCGERNSHGLAVGGKLPQLRLGVLVQAPLLDERRHLVSRYRSDPMPV